MPGRYFPLAISLLCLWITVIVVVIQSAGNNHGHIIYALDDPYIHMAAAKNLVAHGVFGVTPYSFSSASSSILWPLLLAAIYTLAGPNEITPLLLNLAFATVGLFAADYIAARYGLKPGYRLVTLLALVFITPMPAIIMAGLEHNLQIAVTLLFIYLAVQALTEDTGKYNVKRTGILLSVLALLATMARYEDAFYVLIVCALLLARKRFVTAVAVAVAGALPIVVFGAVSIANGALFFPNPVVAKSQLSSINSFSDLLKLPGDYGYMALMTTPPILWLVVGSLMLFCYRYSKYQTIWNPTVLPLPIFVGTALLHLRFSSLGAMYRYEGYLVAAGVLFLSLCSQEYFPEKITLRRLALHTRSLLPKAIAVGVLAFFVCIPFVGRAAHSLSDAIVAHTNIYEQQYQMARFLNQYYSGAAVAANDIGAIDYFADIHLLDLVGLGSTEVVRDIKAQNFDTADISRLVKNNNTRIAVVYDSWFMGTTALPTQWVKVAEWTIPHNVVCGDRTVAFYAVAPTEAAALSSNLRAFSQELPADVVSLVLYPRQAAQAR